MQVADFRDIIKIRERGQITLPAFIRKKFDWLMPLSVIEIKAEGEKLVLRPVMPVRKVKEQSLKVSWKTLRKKLEEIRELGDQKADLSQFVIADRRRR